MKASRPLPAKGPLIAYYGDDLTGSTASMEVTAFAGLQTVLFLSTPTPERLAAFGEYRVIGIAGTARSQGNAWMDRELPGIFSALAALGAPVTHYKVCSTFDSAPQVGSIGHAIDLARKVFDGWIPLVVADPALGRFQSFGHLFALANGTGYRLDRHPTMARHPVTPMDESDLGRHLAKQTAEPIGLVDFVSMKRGLARDRLTSELEAGARIVSLDVLDQETLTEAGGLVWEHGDRPLFGVGSQGFEAALVAWWQKAGLIERQSASHQPRPVDRIACVCGSVSPIAATQIATARGQGFVTIPLASETAVDERAWNDEMERASERAFAALGEGRSVIVHSAAGPDDPAVAALRSAIASSGADPERVHERLGTGLGLILDAILRRTDLRRVVIAGGDTSGRAAATLGIDALTAIAPLSVGAPLCRAHSPDPARNGLELTLKGGQVGGPDFFIAARNGGS